VTAEIGGNPLPFRLIRLFQCHCKRLAESRGNLRSHNRTSSTAPQSPVAFSTIPRYAARLEHLDGIAALVRKLQNLQVGAERSCQNKL
jgi:hypothetical protein